MFRTFLYIPVYLCSWTFLYFPKYSFIILYILIKKYSPLLKPVILSQFAFESFLQYWAGWSKSGLEYFFPTADAEQMTWFSFLFSCFSFNLFRLGARGRWRASRRVKLKLAAAVTDLEMRPHWGGNDRRIRRRIIVWLKVKDKTTFNGLGQTWKCEG